MQWPKTPFPGLSTPTWASACKAGSAADSVVFLAQTNSICTFTHKRQQLNKNDQSCIHSRATSLGALLSDTNSSPATMQQFSATQHALVQSEDQNQVTSNRNSNNHWLQEAVSSTMAGAELGMQLTLNISPNTSTKYVYAFFFCMVTHC